MSGSFPETIKPNAIEIISFTPTLVSTAHNLKRQVRKVGGGVHRWTIKLGFPVMTRAEFAPYEAFIVSQYGRYDTFSYTLPDLFSESLGDYAGTVILDGDHTAGDSSILVSGSSGTLNAGAWVTFNNHNKMYKIIADSTDTLYIFPSLQEDVGTGAVVNYDSPSFNVALVEDSFTYKMTLPRFYEFGVEFIEVY